MRQCGKEFEAWYAKQFGCSPDDWFAAENRYYYGHTQQCWTTWQASRSATIEECAEFVWKFYKIRTLSDEILALKER